MTQSAGDVDGRPPHTITGPMRGLLIAWMVTGILAMGALVLAVIAVNQETTSRRQSARDSCLLLLGLVHSSTPPSRSAQVKAYIARTPLRDCNRYAQTVVR